MNNLRKEIRKIINEQSIPSWEELEAYRILFYPFDMTLITNCPKEKLDTFIDEWNNSQTEGESENIETILKNNGFFAVVGLNSGKTYDIA